jgi:uncharacterized protein
LKTGGWKSHLCKEIETLTLDFTTMKTLSCYTFIFLLLFFSVGVYSQVITPETKATETNENLKLIARYKDGKAELRWYPLTAMYWRTGNRNGYNLERMELSEAGEQTGFKTIAKIRPYTADEWKSKTNGNDKLTTSLARVLNTPNAPAKAGMSFEEKAQFTNDENATFSTFLLATDLSAEGALGAGLRYTDITAEPSTKYIYRLTVNGLKKPTKQDATVAVLHTDGTYQPPKVTGMYLEQKEKAVTIHWDIENDAWFSAYNIERSSNNGTTFERINRLPFRMMTADAPDNVYTDSVKNYVSYQYRVVGITPFADPGTPSDILTGMGVDRTPPSTAMNVKAKGNHLQVNVSWQLPEKSSDAAGLYVGRSSDVAGPFKYLNAIPLSLSTTSFVDGKPAASEPFYAVVVVDKAGNASPSLTTLADVEDKVAPAQPKGLNGKIDSTGVLTLTWEANKEEDFNGYQVYVADRQTDAFFPVSGPPFRQNLYRDTLNLNTLNKSIYLKIKALDYYNNASLFSEIIQIEIPDKVPPIAPVLTMIQADDDANVQLAWEISPSTDVKTHQLYRSSETGNAQLIAVFEPSKPVKTYIDKGVNKNQTHTYSLVAIDKANLQSVSNSLSISPYDSGKRPPVDNLETQYDSEKKKVFLAWRYSKPADGAYKFMLYRASQTQDFEPYKVIQPTTLSFTDDSISKDTYRYAIKVIYKDGGESILVKNW